MERSIDALRGAVEGHGARLGALEGAVARHRPYDTP